VPGDSIIAVGVPGATTLRLLGWPMLELWKGSGTT
jgi:hypothetical protein